ncbi:DUF2188 domain-containing protein [Bacillus sp. FJAT-42376]|uniref:DUF2188 domain-containing protein n=1 Tax=Bacillus sp. FJAT-42376 TaxID=2014076 RepID=UPI000F4E4C14|nr:DUF2188 domain-containing protein [Bacillus sp. FJAT-42376]AZB43187.1 DUF2188 domain-containing protein [Bacillus sp. FJAT-42376]
MPWSSTDYPDSMKNLPEKTRKKAIEIANALLDDKYEEGRAIAIATSQAEKWADDGTGDTYLLHKKDDHWVLEKENSQRASFVYHTKADAIKKARELVHDQNASITVYKEDGSEEQSMN